MKKKRSTTPGSKKADERFMDRRLPEAGLPDAGRIQPVPPSKEALQRLLAIPLLHAGEHSAVRVAGRIALDSWQHGPAIALRDVEDGHVRRLRFEAGGFALEVLAERTGREWEFTARLRKGERVVHGSVLSLGRRRLLAQRGGYFHWSSKAVPRRLVVLLFSQQLVFEGIPWS